MTYGNIILNVSIAMPPPPPPTTRQLRSGHVYATVSPPSNPRGRSSSNGRRPAAKSARGRSKSNGRARSASAGRGTGGRSKTPAGRQQRPRSNSTARNSTSRPSPPAAPPSVVDTSPRFDDEALRQATRSSGGPFDSDDDSEDDVDDRRDAFTVESTVRDESEKQHVSHNQTSQMVRFRDFSNPLKKGSHQMFKDMTRAEIKDDPNFKPLTGSVSDGTRAYVLMKMRYFEYGEPGFGAGIIPTSGTGALIPLEPPIWTTPAISNLAVLGDWKDLYDENQSASVTLEQVLCWSNFIWGGPGAGLTLPKKVNGFYQYIPLNIHVQGRIGELIRQKLKYQNSSQTVLMTVKSNMQKNAFTNHQLICEPHRWKCVVTGTIIHCGVIQWYLLIKKAMKLTKMKVLQLKSEFENLTFESVNFDVEAFIEKLQYAQHRIREVAGENACTDDRFIEKVLAAFDSNPPLLGVPLFHQTALNEKQLWASSGANGKTKEEILEVFLSVYRSMEMENRWDPSVKPKHDATIVALTAQLNENKNLLSKATAELSKAQKQIQAAKPQSCASMPATKFNEKLWRTTKVGDTCVHPKTGEKFVWCGLGHGSGSYMPDGHDHQVWAKQKEEKNRKWNEAKKRKSEDEDSKPAAKKGGALKLSSDVQQAFTTSVQSNLMENWHFSEHEAKMATDVKEESKE